MQVMCYFIRYIYFLVQLLVLQFLHESIYANVLDQLVGLYKQVKIGNPLEKGTLVGPLHTRTSVENFQKGISVIKSQACFILLFSF